MKPMKNTAELILVELDCGTSSEGRLDYEEGEEDVNEDVGGKRKHNPV